MGCGCNPKGGGTGGGAVSSVFGRISAVVAQLGDYAASLVSNDSTVAGATVAAALNTLSTAIAAVASSVAGLTTSNIADASNLPGTTATDVLNYLGGQTPNSIAGGATPAITFATSRYQILTLNQNATAPTMTVPPAGVMCVLEIVQGAGPFTFAWPAIVDLQTAASGGGTPTLTPTNGQRNIFILLSNGTRLRLMGLGEFA